MKIHIYDYLNKNKKATLKGEDFNSVDITHTIDDFSTCRLSHGINSRISSISFTGFDNIYVEDDNGKILFGGILVSINVDNNSESMVAYDHRWILARLILDEVITVNTSSNLLDIVEQLITSAKAKRNIPITFDRANSAFNSVFKAELSFEIGDDIASCLQKIIQTYYARWAMRYKKDGNNIYGSLIVRSINGVTPEGVGISRSISKSEDGDVITLFYGEGDKRNNIQNFNFTFDLSSYTSRTKMGIKIGSESQFVNVPPNPFSGAMENLFGLAESFVTDYKATSEDTAKSIGKINQTYPRQDFEVVMSPLFNKRLNCGDRVNITIISSLLAGVKDFGVRIDNVTYSLKDGYFETRLFVNSMNPQKRTGTLDFLQVINSLQGKLDDLNKKYFNS